jgi:hypothetical protein
MDGNTRPGTVGARNPAAFSVPRRESPTVQRFAPATSSREELSSRAAEQQPRIVLTDEVTLLRAIPASHCGGNQRQGYLSDALPLSYGSLRHRWESNPRLSAPDVTLAFTTPQTLPYSSLLTSLPHYSSSRTPVAGPWEPTSLRQITAMKKSGRNRRSRSFGV